MQFTMQFLPALLLLLGPSCAQAYAINSSNTHTGIEARSDYDPSYTGSWCYGHPYQVSGVDLTCPPAAFSWEVYLPGWGAPDSAKDPQSCGKGFLDNLRGRCGVISAWGCTRKNNNQDTYYTFNTDIECRYWDVQDAFQAANGGTGGLWCIRGACEGTNPLEGGSHGAIGALEGIIEAFGDE